MLPYILQPTKVTGNTATVIDTIFSNNIHGDTISGNVLLTLSELFSQFVSVNRGKIDFKKINMYQREYSKYSNKSFRDDVPIQNWNYTHEDVHDAFKDFYTKLEGSTKEIKLKNKPWLNAEIFKMIKIRKGNPIMRTVNVYLTY